MAVLGATNTENATHNMPPTKYAELSSPVTHATVAAQTMLSVPRLRSFSSRAP